jgi:hypothetical protein
MTADDQKGVLTRMNIGHGIDLDKTRSLTHGTKLWELSSGCVHNRDAASRWPVFVVDLWLTTTVGRAGGNGTDGV